MKANRLRHFAAKATLVLCLVLQVASVNADSKGLAPEPIGKVLTLPSAYPDNWLFAHDANFFALMEGKVILLDIGSANRNYKGAIGAAHFGTFIASASRSELYVGESFYSRGTRGTKTDVVTIYDKSTLAPIGEIVLPFDKRGLAVTQKNAFQLTRDEGFLLVFNFTPAASVTVIDIERRKILSEVGIPGCSLIYPTGKRGFSSICANGSMVAYALDKDGKVEKQTRVPVFFDVDDDPMFAKTAEIDGTAYFPTFKGFVQPVDLAGIAPTVGARWSLVGETQAAENWRPGGWQIVSAHPSGKLYVLMHKDGYDGSHKDGGSEVWEFDVKSQQRSKVFKLERHGVSIEVTKGPKPLLAVTNADMQLDIYDAVTGEFIRMIGGAAAMPLVLHSAH